MHVRAFRFRASWLRAFLHSGIRALTPAAAAALLVLLSPAPVAAQIYETVGIRAQGMSGAFVSIADDASATWWNPAGLAAGGYINMLLEFDRIEDSSHTRASGFALTVPSLGLSYYRLSLRGMRTISTIVPPPANREDEGVLSQFGVTVGQSLGSHVVIASTAKLVHGLDTTRGDLDAGVMAIYGRTRAGLAVKNIRNAELGESVVVFSPGRQARAGASLKLGSASTADVTVALDGDLTTTPTAVGDVRHLASGVEAWLFKRTVGVRGGLGINTVGLTRRSWSAGASSALKSGFYIDAQLTRGDDVTRNGWGFDLRVTF
jgi:hypothetical protein